LYGYGCNKCGDNATADARRFSVEDFIKRARSVHGEIYHYNNVVYTTAHEKIEIICKNHGSFKQKPSSHLDGSGCPNCKHKTEEKVLRLLRTRYPTTVTQFKQEWCRRIHMLPYDFCIPNLNIIIELDGLQHFQQVSNWGTPEFHFENDKYKEKCANSQQFSVVRITQNDAWNDTYDWLSELTAAIDEIKALPVGEVCNKYLCKNGEYDAYK
jgi:very-short-patch-repair endonuclease